MLKIGLVGVGGISGAHIPAWDEMKDAELVALCDIRPEQMEKYSDRHCYTDFNEMLAKEELDILDICLPTYLHTEFALKAINRGINVITEKPVSLKMGDVKKIYDAVEKNRVKFMVAQVLRFWPEYVFVKNACDSGKYGKPLSGSMHRLGTLPAWSWDNWMSDEKRSGLVSYDLHIHDVDFLVYTFGKPARVRSSRSKRPDQDYISAVYEYDGFFISADAAWYAAPYPFKASFTFQFEKAVISNETGELTVYQNDGAIYKPLTEKADGDTGSINLPKSNAYANEIRYFADCVKADRNADIIKPEELETVIDILNGL